MCVGMCACLFVSVYVCIRVREPHALSAEVEVGGRGDPQVILPYSGHALQKEPKGRGGRRGGDTWGGGVRGQRMRMQKNGTMSGLGEEEGKRGRPDKEGGQGEQLRTFLQIVLLQTLAG